MHFPAQGVKHPVTPSLNGQQRTRPTEDVVYQVFTVAAILLVLGSVWVF